MTLGHSSIIFIIQNAPKLATAWIGSCQIKCLCLYFFFQRGLFSFMAQTLFPLGRGCTFFWHFTEKMETQMETTKKGEISNSVVHVRSERNHMSHWAASSGLVLFFNLCCVIWLCSGSITWLKDILFMVANEAEGSCKAESLTGGSSHVCRFLQNTGAFQRWQMAGSCSREERFRVRGEIWRLAGEGWKPLPPF